MARSKVKSVPKNVKKENKINMIHLNQSAGQQNKLIRSMSWT